MSILSYVQEFFMHGLHILSWRDGIEILFFSGLMYSFLIWLKQDAQKNLVSIVYAYASITIATYFFKFYTINYILLSYLPVALIIFMILHQELLQKNFVTLQRVNFYDSYNWFEEFTRSCLSALNSNKEFTCVIERTDSLKNLITAPCIFHADFKKDIFEILIEKHMSSPNSFIWITHDGKIVAINSCWNVTRQEEWITQEAMSVHKWKQDGMFISSKTDALIFKITPLTRTFDLILGGKLLEEISAPQAFTILQKEINIKSITSNEPVSTKSKQQQQTI